MKTTKQLLVSLVFISLILAGCTSQATSTPVPEEDGTRVIRVGTGDAVEDVYPHQEIIALYEAENEDVLVQLELVASEDYNDRLLTELAAKAAPDVMSIDDESVPAFLEANAFVPIENYLPEDFDLNIYLPGLLEPGQVDGVQYLLPKDYSTLAVYYNKEIFDAAGIDYPQDGWTWDDFLDTALELTQDTDGDNAPDIWGVQLPGVWTDGLEYWVAAAGGSLISEDGEEFIGYMDSEAVVDAVTFYADLYNKYRVAAPPTDLTAIGGGTTEFVDGQAAMYISNRSVEDELLANPNIDLGVAAPPQDITRANILFWEGFGVATTSELPKTAAAFLAFYAGTEGSEVWKESTLPTVSTVAESSGLSSDPVAGVWINELNFLVPRAYTYTNYWNETAVPALQSALETAILTKNADIQELMTLAAQEAQTALDALLAQE